MAENSNISWCDHTFNPWVGCTKIAAGCDNCYAAETNARFVKVGDIGNWGPKNANRQTVDSNWSKVRKWNRDAESASKRLKVFCGSMMDWTDKDAPVGALDALWQLIRETPNLDWLLLTKRATLIKHRLPSDWGEGYENVWLGVTVENKEHGFPRLEALREIPAKIKFVSAEPLLENIVPVNLTGIDWVIVGGESGPNARPMKEWWALNLIHDCKILYDIPVWFKQMGGKGKDKGGDLISGEVIKNFPLRRNV